MRKKQHFKKGEKVMNWNEYKDFVKETDPLGKEMLE